MRGSEPNEPNPEPPPEPRTVDELIAEGFVGFIRGSDGFAIVDPLLSQEPEELDKLKWRFDH